MEGPRRALYAAAGLVLLLAGAARGSPEGVAARLTAAARAFLASLDAGQRDAARFAFDDEEPFDLRLAPLFLEGLRMDRMEAAQREALRELLGAGLSDSGLAKVEAIRGLETEVERLEREGGLRPWLQHFLRDPERYYLAVFGEPGDAPWGFRFDGHHVSLNYTLVGDAVPSATPLFLGAQPRVVPAGSEREGLRVLGAEEDLARELLLSLDAAQRSQVTLPFEADRGLFVGEGRRVALEGPPAGLSRSAMAPAQQARLDALVEVYLSNLAGEIAQARRAALEAAGRDAIYFAWAGSATPGEPSYYQGPSFLIEFDNTLEGADHAHTLWRELEGDFGLDLLAQHYAHDPGHRRDSPRTHATLRPIASFSTREQGGVADGLDDRRADGALRRIENSAADAGQPRYCWASRLWRTRSEHAPATPNGSVSSRANRSPGTVWGSTRRRDSGVQQCDNRPWPLRHSCRRIGFQPNPPQRSNAVIPGHVLD